MEIAELINRELEDVLVPLWQKDWRVFARQALGVRLDPDQEAILHSVQHSRRTTVRSGLFAGALMITFRAPA